MKRNIFLGALLALFCWASCSNDDEVLPAVTGMEIIGDDLLAGDTLLYDTTSHTSTLSLVVSGDWSATLAEEADWCGLTRSALPGVKKLLVNVSTNSGPDERSCRILVNGGGVQRTLTVCQIGSTPALKVAPAQFTSLKYDSTEIKFRVVTNVKYTVTVEEGKDWILPFERDALDTISYRFAIRKNGVNTRNGKILVKQVNGELKHEVLVFQQAKESDYTPADAASIKDTKIKVTKGKSEGWVKNAWVTPFHNNDNVPIEKSFDGEYGTQFNSKTANVWPVRMTYSFEAATLDYIMYHPRQGTNRNGDFGEFSVEYRTADMPENTFTKIGDYDFEMKTSASKLTLPQRLENVVEVRFVVTSGQAGFASCGEMEFYMKRISAAKDLFTDETYSALKPDVTMEDIDALEEETDGFLKKIARFLLEGNYPMERVQTYQPYMTIAEVSKRLKTANYNRLENPTGIYFTASDEVVIFMEETSASVALRVVDWSEAGNEAGINTTYTLMPGKNVLKIANDGLGYIHYYRDDYKSAPDVKIHIASGIVNGYFDLEAGDQDVKYTTLLNDAKSAVCPNLDLRGKYVQLCFDKESLLAGNPDRGREMVQEYDNIIKMEQDVMGIDANDLRTTNRMFARRSYSGAPNANSWGVSFPGLNVKPENIRNSSWEIGHEFGHLNQVRPGLKWQGTGEVTNNIYSATVQYYYTPDNLRLEQEKIGDGEGGEAMVGNRFNCYFNNGIIKGQPWLFQKGQNVPSKDYPDMGDLFVRLCPLWQLQLFNKYTGLGVTDFYPQIIDLVRKTDETELTDKELQFNFMRNTCKVMKADMAEFFEKCGMLRELDADVNDYGGAKRLTITREDIDAFKAEIKGQYKNQPVSPVIYYISGNSVNAFKNKAAVVGTTGEGVTGSGSTRLVNASSWKNVVVFETYAGNELVKLTLPFTNFADKTATTVFYPDGATRIEAVAWDGTRTLVYGKR